MDTRSGVVISLGSLLQQASQLLFGIAVARSLGPTEYGWFAIARNVLVWTATLAPLGLDLAVVRYASQFGSHRSFWPKLSRLRALVAIVSIATILIVFAVASRGLQVQGGLLVVLLATLVALPFIADAAVLSGYFRGMRRPVLFSILFDYGQSGTRLVLTSVLFFWGASVVTYASLNAAVAAAGSVIVAAVAFSIRARANDEGAGAGVWAILSVSPWLAFSMVCYGLFRVIDLAVLGAYVSGDELGRYAAISAICVFVQVYPMTLSQSLGPEIAALHLSASLRAARAPIRAFIRQASVMGGFVYGGIAAFGTHLHLLFGEKFHFDPLVLLIMATAWLVSGVLNPTGLALSMTGRHKRESVLLFTGAVLFAAALLTLVPRFGLIGAALSLLLVIIIIQGARIVLVWRIIGGAVGHYMDLLPPILGLTIAYGVDALFRQYFSETLVAVTASCFAYTIFYFLVQLMLRGVRLTAKSA